LLATVAVQPEAFCGQLEETLGEYHHEAIMIISVMIAFAFALCLALFWNRRLRRKARERAALESALRELPVGILIADAPSGHVTFANRAASAILKIPLKELMAVDLANARNLKFSTYEIDGSPCPIERVPLFQAMIKDRICESRELIIRQDKGSESVISSSSAPVRDYTGHTFAVITVFNDVSDARSSALLLRKRSEEIASLFENISQGVALIGPDLRISAFNKRLLEILDLPPDFIKGRPYIDKLVDYWRDSSNPPQDDVDRVRREILSREAFIHEFKFKNRYVEEQSPTSRSGRKPRRSA